jgi:hypothetical protein
MASFHNADYASDPLLQRLKLMDSNQAVAAAIRLSVNNVVRFYASSILLLL